MTNDFDIEVISPKTVFINNTALQEKDVNEAIDTVLDNLSQSGNINDADKVIDTLMGIGTMAGKSLVRLIGGMKVWWDEHNLDDNFVDYIVSKHGLDRVYTQRRIEIQEQVDKGNIPQEIYDNVPLRDLVPIAHTLADGYPISKKEWEEISIGTSKDIARILRDIKKKPPKKNTLDLVLERDGSINVWYQDKKHFVGYLKIDDGDEVVKKAISRIEHGSGIRRK